jgi:tetrahydromethanopterin S-methyltransferase subunit B
MANTTKPKTIFEHIALGLQTVNDNIVDLYAMVQDIHNALYPTEPNATGTESDTDKIGGSF